MHSKLKACVYRVDSGQNALKNQSVSLLIFIDKQSETSVDPDQLALQKPADLDLLSFQNRIYLGLAWLNRKLNTKIFLNMAEHHVI